MATTTPTLWADLGTVNTTTAGEEEDAHILGLPNGNVVVTWEVIDGANHSLLGQIFDPLGNPVGGELLLREGSGNDGDIYSDAVLAVRESSDSNFLVAYATHRASGDIVSVRQFDSTGGQVLLSDGVDHTIVDLTIVNTINLHAGEPSIASFADGSFVVAYTTNLTAAPGDTDTAFKIVSANNIVGTEQPLLADVGGTDDNAHNPQVAVLSNGDFVAVWDDEYNADPADSDVFFQIFNASGGTATASGTSVSGAFNLAQETHPDVAALSGGGFVVVWTDSTGDGPGDEGIRATIYSNTGVIVAADIQINTTTTGNQSEASVTALADGGFLVAWEDDQQSQVLAQRFDATGIQVGTEFVLASTIGGGDGGPDLTTLIDGRIGFAVNPLTGNIATSIWDPRTSPIAATEGNDVYTGRADGGTVFGLGGADTLFGGAGKDTLVGGTGADTMKGGGGDDLYYVDDAGDQVVEGADAGDDTVYTTVSFVLGANVEKLHLVSGAIDGTGNSLANAIFGNSSVNTLIGGDGADDLDGGGGADTMKGGTGSDTYIVDNPGDVVDEVGGTGTDLVKASVTFSLADVTHAKGAIENLMLTDDGDFDATGNGLDNELTGNSGKNTLDGGAGADTMRGGLGNDTYIVDNAGDVADETGGDGVDLVRSAISFSFVDVTHAKGDIENLILTGSGDIDATGNALANELTGNDGANTLDGGGDADTMRGGLGNDTYIVDNAGDVVDETGGDGTDVVESAISFNLADGTRAKGTIENLTLTGGGAINATGNGLANILSGNGGKNTLDGKAGADTMKGFGGNDTYLVDNAGDVVDETGGGGTDLVRSSVSFSFADAGHAKGNIEDLTLLGGGNLNATGNALANRLTGNGGANTLDGKGGADTMKGFGGNDTYVVDNAGDVVDETGGSGTDLVKSSVGFSLADAGHAKGVIENLTLLGSGAVNGAGNALANVLTGNAAANSLFGDMGNDVMIGGGGADSFLFGTRLSASNVDAIDDFAVNLDKIGLDGAIFKKVGAKLSKKEFYINKKGKAHDSNDFVVYNKKNGDLIYDKNGSKKGGAKVFAELDRGLKLDHKDFFVYDDFVI